MCFLLKSFIWEGKSFKVLKFLILVSRNIIQISEIFPDVLLYPLIIGRKLNYFGLIIARKNSTWLRFHIDHLSMLNLNTIFDFMYWNYRKFIEIFYWKIVMKDIFWIFSESREIAQARSCVSVGSLNSPVSTWLCKRNFESYP